VQRLEQEQRTRENDRVARLKSLATDMARIEAQIPGLEVSIRRLGYEIERRRVRAPVAGKLGEAVILRPARWFARVKSWARSCPAEAWLS
jgi:membrane fusion protein (multidrug efflux system)